MCFHTEIMKTPRTPSRNSVNMITEIKGIATEARPDKQVCAVLQGYKLLSPSPIFMILYPNFIKLYKICAKYKYTFGGIQKLAGESAKGEKLAGRNHFPRQARELERVRCLPLHRKTGARQSKERPCCPLT